MKENCDLCKYLVCATTEKGEKVIYVNGGILERKFEIADCEARAKQLRILNLYGDRNIDNIQQL